MAEAREIPPGTYNLKLGETFQSNVEKSAYHTLRCKLIAFFKGSSEMSLYSVCIMLIFASLGALSLIKFSRAIFLLFFSGRQLKKFHNL